jgi:hypothetical protein
MGLTSAWDVTVVSSSSELGPVLAPPNAAAAGPFSWKPHRLGYSKFKPAVTTARVFPFASAINTFNPLNF